jgi:RND family efflux transporter MFP subunit
MQLKLYRLILFISIFILMSALSCGKAKDEKQKDAQKQAAEQVISINTAKVEGRSIKRVVETAGTLMPWDEVVISSEIGGTIEEMLVDMGDKVSKGAVLLRLDQREARLNYEIAQKTLDRNNALLQDARNNLKRSKELFDKGIISSSERDNIQTQHDIADAQAAQSESALALAKKRLEDTVITAPITGEIKKRSASKGETIKDKTPLFTVVNADQLKFYGTIPEKFSPQIRVGQAINIQVDAYGDKVFSGRIERVSPAIDLDTRTLAIEAKIPNPKSLLKAGFFAKGIVATVTESNVPFVPEAAIYSSLGITKLFVIADGIAKEKNIKLGIKEGSMVEVANDIKAGDIVAVTNLNQLYDGAKVNPVKEQ